MKRIFFFNSDPRIAVSLALRIPPEEESGVMAFGDVVDYVSSFLSFKKIWRVEEQLPDPYRSADFINTLDVKEVVVFLDRWNRAISSYQKRFLNHVKKKAVVLETYDEISKFLKITGKIRPPRLKKDSLDEEFVSLVQKKRGDVDVLLYLGDFPQSAYFSPSAVIGFVERYLEEHKSGAIYLLGSSAFHQIVKENFDVSRVVNLLGVTSPIQNFLFAEQAKYVIATDSSFSVFLSSLATSADSSVRRFVVFYSPFEEDICCPPEYGESRNTFFLRIKLSLTCSGCSFRVCPFGVPARCMSLANADFLYRIFKELEGCSLNYTT